MRSISLILFLLFSIPIQAQCLKADIIFLLDWSGSEDSNRVYIPMAADDFLKSLNIGESAVKVGVISFNTSPIADKCMPLSGNREAISDKLYSLILTWPHGGTDMTTSMRMAHNYFEASEQARGEPVMRLLMLISDGNEEIFSRSETQMLCNRMKLGGALVWCIATPNAFKGNEAAREHLMNLSSGAGMGFYVEQYYAHIRDELLRLELCP